jgi:hypothetical protein
MALKVIKVPVWVGGIPDQPGGLAAVLGTLADAGANLKCVVARRPSARPGTATVFVSPITGRKQEGAAREAGLTPITNVVTLRVEGDDQPGLGRRITQAVADAGVSLHGLTTAVVGKKFVVYLAFDTEADATYASTAMSKLGGRTRKPRRVPKARPRATARAANRSGTRKTTKRATKRQPSKAAKRAR